MIHLITYGDNNFKKSRHRVCNEAKNTGWFDTIKAFSPDDLSNDFRKKYKNILEYRRGGGYMIWKPYVIVQTLNKINENDILIFIDAGCTINKQGEKRFYEYIEMLNDDNPIISFQLQHLEYKWTTKEIFEYFNVLDNDKITNSEQVMTATLIMKKNDKLLKLMKLWETTLQDNPLLFTDYYNKNQLDNNFIENRHDQSIFSVIRKMNNPLLLNDETWFVPFGNKESLKYPFWATRIRN